MTSMNTLVCQEPKKLHWEKRQIPIPGDDEVLIKIKTVGICGTDIHAWGGNQPFFSYPRVLGHEICGEIIGLGKNILNLKSGQQVAVIPYVACGQCPACLSGRTNCCEKISVIGVHRDGGFSEYLCVPVKNLLVVDDVEPEAAALIEPFAISAHAVRRAAIRAGEQVLVVGAGVAGLQAIATARRLGAQVEGFDVRPETREQIESLGGKFLDLGVSAAGEGGYARALTDEERAEQQRRLAEHLKNVDVIVTTAAVPGRPAPKIITAAMVEGMKPGSVVVDFAAETGGNCELTRPGETFEQAGVTIAGPLNLASQGALHASEMYARNVFNFLALSVKDGAVALDWDDELVAKTCLVHAGERRG